MKTHRVELQNGTLVRIEGGDAQQVANFISNRLNGQQVLTTAAGEETPMLMPTLNFAKEAKQEAVVNTSEELPLEIPVLKFA